MIAYALASATVAAGLVSLSLFGRFLWTGGLGLVDWRLGWPAALAWDAGLSLAFFLQHSGMIRRKAAARWYRIGYTWASAAVLAAVTLLWQPSRIDLAIVAGPGRWAIRIVFALSLVVVAWGIGALGSFDLFGVQALVRGRPPDKKPLAVSGPYRWVRHPFYAAGIVAIWACPNLTLDRLLFDLLWTGWIVLGARLEERDLVAEFGEPYRLYQRQVPMLVPGFHRKSTQVRIC